MTEAAVDDESFEQEKAGAVPNNNLVAHMDGANLGIEVLVAAVIELQRTRSRHVSEARVGVVSAVLRCRGHAGHLRLIGEIRRQN